MLPTHQILGESLTEDKSDVSIMAFVFHAGLLHVLVITFPVLCSRLCFCGWKPNYLDVVLAVVCSAMTDQIVQWGKLTLCGGGISMWLLGVYIVVIISALLHYIQSDYLGIDSCLMLYISQDSNKGQNKLLMQALSRCWIAMLAFLSCLTVFGVMSLVEILDTECLANGDWHASLEFVVTVLTLSGLSVIIGAVALFYAKVVSGSLSRGSAALQAITDKDFVERWGEPRPVLEEDLKCGLQPQEIAGLPCMEASCCHAEGLDCVICLSSILPADRVRLLPRCSHAFHRPCIDQWLLRAGNCPLCKLKPVLDNS